MLFFYYFIKECIRSLGIENLIAIHHRNKILCIRKIDDIVCIARKHDHRLNFVSRDCIFKNLRIRIILVAHPNESMTTDYDELLPLGVMPMLSLCNSGLEMLMETWPQLRV